MASLQKQCAWISLDAISETSALQLIQFCAIRCQPEQALKYSEVESCCSKFFALNSKPYLQNLHAKFIFSVHFESQTW